MSKFLMAVLQIDSQADKKANLDKVGRFIDEAASHGARFVAMAENVHYCGPVRPKGWRLRQRRTDSRADERIFRRQGQAARIWLHCGSIGEVVPGENKLYNRRCFTILGGSWPLATKRSTCTT